MLGIQGYSSGNGVEAAANTNALRVSERPMNVGAYGSYSFGSPGGIEAAGASANSPIFSMRSAAANGPNVVIRRFTFNAMAYTTAFTAGQALFQLFVARAFSASDTGGTQATMTTNNMKRRTAFATTALQDLRYSTTGVLTAGTRTLDGTPIASLGAPVPATSVSYNLVGPWDMLRYGPEAWPLILAPNEGLILQATVPATGTWQWFVSVDWDEIPTTEI
jgi:hypothetical protein